MHTARRLPVILLGATLALSAYADPSTVNDKVYTDEQAEAGEAVYESQCLSCHDKKYFRPIFKAWNGQSLGLLFDLMAASMPQNNPGSLPDKDYVDILAFALSQSRYPAGDTELTHQKEALEDILIAPRK